MATATVANAASATLGAGVADTVNFTGLPAQEILVHNRGTVDIWFRIDGSAAVAAAAENYYLPAGTAKSVTRKKGIGTVSLISAGTPAYTVEAYR